MFFKFKKIQNINRQIHVLNMLQCVSPQHPTLSLFAIFVLSSLLVVQSLSCVRLFAVPWTAAHQASLSFTNTKRLLRLMPTESVMPSSHLHLCCPLLLLPLSFLASGSFLESWLFTSDGQCIGASARLILSVEMIMATTCPSSWVYQNSRWGEEGEKGQPYLSTPQGEGKDRRERSSPFMPVSTSHVTSRFQNSKWMNIYKECIRRVWKIDWFPVYSSVQSLSHVRLFANPWIAARQASLSITSSRSLLKLMSVESVMPSSHLILCHPLLLLPPIPPSIRVFSNESTLHQSIVV